MKEDEYNYVGNHVPSTTMGIMKRMEVVCKKYGQLETPYIIFQGGSDKLVDPFVCIDLERESPSKDKTTVIYRHMWHEIPYEPEYEEICHLISKWINARLPSSPGSGQVDLGEQILEKNNIFCSVIDEIKKILDFL